MVFSPSLSFLLSRSGGGERLVVSGMGTATASAPSLGLVLHSRHCRSENILLPQSLTLLSFSSLQRIFVSTKGKLFNIPWENARPGSEVPSPPGCPSALGRSSHLAAISAPTGTQPPSHRVNPSPANAPHPSLSTAGGDVSLTAWHTRPPAVPCRAVLPRGCPRVLRLMGTRWAPSIPPSWLASRLLSGRGEAGRTPRTLQVPPCFICSYQWGNRGFCVCFLERRMVRAKLRVCLAPGQFPCPIVYRRSPLFGDNGAKFPPTVLPGRLLPARRRLQQVTSCPLLPPPSSSLPTLQSGRADAAS